MSDRPCTCHPDDNPPVPCPQKYALSECKFDPKDGTTLPPSGDAPAELAEILDSGARLVEAFHLMPGVARAMREAACLLRKSEYGHGVCTMKERAERAERDRDMKYGAWAALQKIARERAEQERDALRAEIDEIHATGGTSYARLNEALALLKEARGMWVDDHSNLAARIDALLKDKP